MRRQFPHELARRRRLVRPGQHADVPPNRDADLAVRHRPGDLLQRQGVMASVGELVNYGGVIAGKALLQDDRQAIGPASEVLAVAGSMGITPGRLERSRRCTQDYPAARPYAALLTDPSLFAGQLRRLSGAGDAVPAAGEPGQARLVAGERPGGLVSAVPQRGPRRVHPGPVLSTSHHLLLDGKSYRPRRRPARAG
jgi:hypothetical protein